MKNKELKEKIKRAILSKLKAQSQEARGPMTQDAMGVTVKAKNEQDLVKGLSKARELLKSGKVQAMREGVEEAQEQVSSKDEILSKMAKLKAKMKK